MGEGLIWCREQGKSEKEKGIYGSNFFDAFISIDL